MLKLSEVILELHEKTNGCEGSSYQQVRDSLCKELTVGDKNSWPEIFAKFKFTNYTTDDLPSKTSSVFPAEKGIKIKDKQNKLTT